jgi:hypothetical protein
LLTPCLNARGFRKSFGDFDYAARLALSALPIVQEISAKISVARVVAILKQLEESTFKNNPEVARLGFLLKSSSSSSFASPKPR